MSLCPAQGSQGSAVSGVRAFRAVRVVRTVRVVRVVRAARVVREVRAVREVRVVRAVRAVPWSGHRPYIKRVESKISLSHVLTAIEETSQVWAVLKLFLKNLRRRKKERKKEEFVSTRPVGFAAGKKTTATTLATNVFCGAF